MDTQSRVPRFLGWNLSYMNEGWWLKCRYRVDEREIESLNLAAPSSSPGRYRSPNNLPYNSLFTKVYLVRYTPCSFFSRQVPALGQACATTQDAPFHPKSPLLGQLICEKRCQEYLCRSYKSIFFVEKKISRNRVRKVGCPRA